MSDHVLRAGATATDAYDLAVSPETAGWTHSGLRVLRLPAGGSSTLETGDSEVVVLSLGGAAEVVVDDARFSLEGRDSVFDGPSDIVYAPRDSTVSLASAEGGRFALCSAVCEARLAPAYLPRSEVPVELRGAGQASRQVNNFCTPDAFEADRLIACEVLTPAGNWSSYPPHKHDEDRPGESVLEEIYYFEVAAGPSGPGVAYQRVYGHARSSTDVLAEVATGDVVLIPDGWHGPSMAAPGYDLYYLNVMAGPGDERAWRICDDPAHSWVRETWADQRVDPRLPFGQEGSPS